jgi:D-methionine transport system permease protein
MFDSISLQEFFDAFLETLYMSFISTLFVFAFGLILGIILFFVSPQGLRPNHLVYTIVSIFANLIRSIPFLILIVLLIPFTRLLMGTILGASAALPALIIGATPFFARIVEINLKDKGYSLIETGRAFGGSDVAIITKIILPESLIAIVQGITTTSIMITGFTSIAGAIGAGGLGHMAYLYGFARGKTEVTIIATIGIIIIILFTQLLGDVVVKILKKT